MANAFTAIRTWRTPGPGNDAGLPLKHIEGTLVIDTTATGGATAGDLPASMFGLTQLVGPQGFATNDDNSKIIATGPSYDGTSLMVGSGTAGAVADLPNDTYKLTVIGY